MLVETLEKFGLSDKEAVVYLSLLELGPSVVSAVAKRSHINRSTAYVVLGFLMKRGFVSISDTKSVRLYNAVSPEFLVKLAQESADRYNELVHTAKTLLPELKSLRGKTDQKPKVQFFDGEEGIKAVRQEMFVAESIRVLLNEKDHNSAEVSTFGNKIALIAPNEKFALIIQSDELSGALRGIGKKSKK